MQSVASRIWTRVAVFISYNDNDYTTGTSTKKNIQLVGLIRVFANGPGDQGSIPGWVIRKTQKIVVDAASLNIQHYKVWVKSKVEQSREWSCALHYTLV